MYDVPLKLRIFHLEEWNVAKHFLYKRGQAIFSDMSKVKVNDLNLDHKIESNIIILDFHKKSISVY